MDYRNGVPQPSRRNAGQRPGPSPEEGYGQAAAFSRSRGSTRYDSSINAKQRKKTIATVIIAVIAVALVAAIAIAAAGFGFYTSVGARLTDQYDNDERLQAVLADQQQTAIELTSNWTDSTPFYMLLLGVDSDQNRMVGGEAELYGDDESNYRTDTIILARVDPGNKKVALVSIHRDTWIPIDGVEQKINNAYSLGGVAKTIEVVSDFAGVPISHYAQVNLDGFVAIVDALGGLEVTIPIEINDPEYSGAHFDAGTQVLNGQQATLFARIRHAYDDLGDGDRYRAANQRQLISVLIQRIMSATPVEMVNIINTLAGYVNTDFTLDQIVNLALAMRGIDVNNDVYTTMNPTESHYENDIWYETNLDYQWEQIMWAVDAGDIPAIDADIPQGLGTIEGAEAIAISNSAEASTVVLVKDATGDPSRSAQIASTLQGNGWQQVIDGGEANIYREEGTVVVFDEYSGHAGHAQNVASQIGAATEPAGELWSLADGVDVMIVTGAASYM